ncbi:MAG: ribosome biogenesis GTP-binding protein YihA/YsxC [Oscillospiraceae bacterium]|nr:ribosome biogenesis GTP-binding protein YihA/YsxC [Oscillospiraceae bacterium]
MKYESFTFETSFGVSAQLKASEMPEIAFAGRSNVGKSSLLNKLLNRKNLARVSSVPGKTATINFFKGAGVRFVDLPGYGYAKVSRDEKARWGSLMEHYFGSGRDIRLVVQLTDMRHPITADDRDMLDFLTYHHIPFAVVMTKADKLNKTETAKRMEEIQAELAPYAPQAVIPFSALKGTGVPELKRVIEASLQ